MKKLISKNLRFFFCFLSLLTFSGCSGGGGDSAGSPAQEEIPSSVGDAPSAKVVLLPNDSEVTQGAEIIRTIEVQDVEKAFFVFFDLSYDPTIIESVDAEEGTFLSRNGTEATSFQAALENNTQGKITFGLTRLGKIGDVSGHGLLVTLHFRAIGPGTTPLVFSDPKGLGNSENEDVTIDVWKDSTVTVQ